jgi:hypothetical protein
MLCSPMTAHSPLSGAFATDAPGWDRPAFERQIAMLGELAEAGLEVAQAIRDQTLAAAARGDLSSARIDFGLAYARAAKAVRMTLALQRNYLLDLRFEFRHGEPAPAWDRPAPKPRANEADRIRHGLDTGNLSEAKAVKQLDQTLDLYERLIDRVEDLDDDIPDGPFNEIVGKLCKDLGLAPDWMQRTEARLWSEAAGSPPAQPPPRTAVGAAAGPSHAIDPDGPLTDRSEERVVMRAAHRRRLARSRWRNTS